MPTTRFRPRPFSLVPVLAIGLAAHAAHARTAPADVALVGITSLDAGADHETVVWEIDTQHPERRREVVTLQHQAGFAPLGVVDDRHLILVLRDGSVRDASLVVVDRQTGQQRVLMDEVVPLQRPAVAHCGRERSELAQCPAAADGDTIRVLRSFAADPAGASFEVVDVNVADASQHIRQARRALWQTPIVTGGLPQHFLVVDGGDTPKSDGVFSRTDLAGTKREVIGRGIFRHPIQLSALTLVERDDGHGHGQLEVIAAPTSTGLQGKVLLKGLAGLSPVLAGDHRLVVGNGRKDGGLVVVDVGVDVGADVAGVVDGTLQTRPVKGVRAGVARPQAALGSLAVVWLDRGAAVPGELWAVDVSAQRDLDIKSGAHALLPAMSHTAVTVYGVSATSTSSTPPPKGAR